MFEKALSALDDGVMILDHDQKLLYANPALARLAGEELSYIIGRQLLEVIRSPELADLAAQLSGANQARETEFSLLFPQKLILLASAYPIPEGAVVILRDVTEIKRLENLRHEFVANVSHELKTPLTAIRNYVETLLDGAVDDPSHKKAFLQKIEKNALNLSNLINDILAISKIEGRREYGTFSPVDLFKVAGKVAAELADRAAAKKISIQLLGAADLFITNGVEDQLYRAMINLLDNAINYSPPGGTIKVACQRRGEAIEFSVEDNGIGIPPEHLDRIFERFYRVDKGRSRELGGTGLGLAIVKHIMGLHSGFVRVESEEGKGSRFYLVFPQKEFTSF